MSKLATEFKKRYKMKDEHCFYCQKDQRLDDLMIEICPLEVSTFFLFKEQTYHGRCLVAYRDHVNELYDLNDAERNAFMKDVCRAAKAMAKTFHPRKINYGAYADTMSHLHFHLVPKYEGGPSFGGVFEMNPRNVYLTDSEYAEMIKSIRENL
jgi:diadenosine tetraphosphate (Ap4A) HIT family hydrolase